VGGNMKKRLIAGAALTAFMATAAQAADFPITPAYGGPIIVPAYRWSGFYLGANAGGHFGNDKITTTTTPILAFTPADAVAIDSASPTTLNPKGFIGGLQGGYNWQFNQIVVGFEVDANWMSGTANRTLPLNLPTPIPNESMFNQTNAAFLLTARPRVGWVWDRALLYVTGGYAMGNVKFNDFFNTRVAFGPLTFGTVTTAHMSGWTAGLGFEYGLSEAWTVKAEYLYVDLGTASVTSAFSAGTFNAGDTLTYNHKYTDNVARVGLNYRFGAF
jgi:outer membrane immunogenic protein